MGLPCKHVCFLQTCLQGKRCQNFRGKGAINDFQGAIADFQKGSYRQN